MTQAVEPVEKGLSRFNQKLHKISQNINRRTKDDSFINETSPTTRVIRGIDDPLLNGSYSDSGTTKKKRHRKKSAGGGYTSAESGGESSSSDHMLYHVRGRRWVTKD